MEGLQCNILDRPLKTHSGYTVCRFPLKIILKTINLIFEGWSTATGCARLRQELENLIVALPLHREVDSSEVHTLT